MSHPNIAAGLNPKLKDILIGFFESGSSEAYSIADCLNTIAENGDEYTSDAFMLAAAEILQDAATTVITALTVPTDVTGFPLTSMRRRRGGLQQAIGYLKTCLGRFEACKSAHHPVSRQEIPVWMDYLQTILDRWPLEEAAIADLQLTGINPQTQELCLLLDNGRQIRSGWIDKDDPDALPSGDYISVINTGGEQVFYVESVDLFADPLSGRVKLNQMLQACLGTGVTQDPPQTQ